jgi:hypothetical protein
MWQRLQIFWLEMERLQGRWNPFAFGQALEVAFGDQRWLKAWRKMAGLDQPPLGR